MVKGIPRANHVYWPIIDIHIHRILIIRVIAKMDTMTMDLILHAKVSFCTKIRLPLFLSNMQW